MKTSTPHPEEYDLVILGSGAGGKLIAWTSAQKGQRVVVVERKYVGGSCPNIACLPSKNIIHSAKCASFFYRSNEFDISKENVRINMAAVRERKRKMVVNVVDSFRDHYFTKSGAELVIGTGRFVGPKTIEVALNDGGTRTFRGKNVAVNTGSRATLEPIPGLAEAKPLTHIEAFELDHIPKRLSGSGRWLGVGLELAQAFRRFGAEVTLIDRNGRLAHHEDEDASQGLEELKTALEAAGSDLEDVMKVNVICVRPERFKAFNEIYKRYFPKIPPARIFFCVPVWTGPFDIEIECIAVRKD